MSERLEPGPKYPRPPTIQPVGFVIGANGESDGFFVSFSQALNSAGYESLLKGDGPGSLFLYGYITYADIFGDEHTTGFAITWDKGAQALRLATDEEAPGYNYNQKTSGRLIWTFVHRERVARLNAR
jgi:hypothetical protein